MRSTSLLPAFYLTHTPSPRIVAAANKKLAKRHKIKHTTIQVQSENCGHGPEACKF